MASTQTEKKTNKILWFLFAIVIPLIIVLIIIGVVLNFLGFSVIDWTKEKGSDIPIVSNFISTPEEVDYNKELNTLTETLEMKDAELEQMDVKISDLESTISDLETELSRRDQTIAQLESQELLEEAREDQSADALKDVAKTYEEMKPARAAAILSNLDVEEILPILKELSIDTRGDILQAMEDELAARLTVRLMQ